MDKKKTSESKTKRMKNKSNDPEKSVEERFFYADFFSIILIVQN